jgi:hypothetical protein
MPDFMRDAQAALDSTTPVSDSDSDYAGYPPMLAAALNSWETTPQVSNDDMPAFAPLTMQMLLSQIESRLNAGLSAVWNTRAGNPGGKWSGSDPEEKWARGISEMLFGIKYGGPGVQYFNYFAGAMPWNMYLFLRVAPYFNSEPQFVNGSLKLLPSQSYWGWRRVDWGVPEDSIASGVNTDPASSLFCACQHLTTYAQITRGHNWFGVMGGEIGASRESIGLPMFRNYQNGWIPASGRNASMADTSALIPVSAALANGSFGPGSVYIYDPNRFMQKVTLWMNDEDKKAASPNPSPNVDKLTQQWIFNEHVKETSDQIWKDSRFSKAAHGGAPFDYPLVGQRGDAHAQFVLRVDKNAQKAQLLNTAINQVDLNKDAVRLRLLKNYSNFGSGGFNGDGKFLASIGSASYFVGIGNAEGGQTDPANLAAATNSMLNARPVGLARLVVMFRNEPDGDPVFVSRMLCTWGRGGPRQNYTIARLVHSLRDLPGRKNLQAFWMVYIPTGSFAYAMWKHGARNTAQNLVYTGGFGFRDTSFITCITHTTAGQCVFLRPPSAKIQSITESMQFPHWKYQRRADDEKFTFTPQELPWFFPDDVPAVYQ